MSSRPDASLRARRMIALLPMLKQGESIRISELASAVGCTAEQVAADLATLTMCGIPPFSPGDLIDLAIDGDSVTVYLEPAGLDRPLRLTNPEARALSAALEVAGYDASDPLLQKLFTAASAAVSGEELERTLRAGAARGGVADIYSRLASAIDGHVKVRLVYFTGSTGTVSERVVQPWALVVQRGVWYLTALCEQAQTERVFRLDRIRSAEPTGERFAPPPVIPLAVTPSPTDLPIADVRFAVSARLPDENAWPGAVFDPQPDGSTIVHVPYQSVSWMARRVVAGLGASEVLGPREVRDAVRMLAEATLREIP